MKDCPNKKENLTNCNCSYSSCSRKGVCCQCVAYHRQNNQIPACFFPADIEKTYDRSINRFVELHK